jgi:hypothetical protein
MEAGTSAPLEQGYPGTAVAGAALGTLFFPLFALILALLLTGGQPNTYKRAQLRMWAWVSAGWLVLQVVLVMVALASVTFHSSGSGPTHSDIASVTTTTP